MHPQIGTNTTLGSYGRPIPRMFGAPNGGGSLKLSGGLLLDFPHIPSHFQETFAHPHEGYRGTSLIRNSPPP